MKFFTKSSFGSVAVYRALFSATLIVAMASCGSDGVSGSYRVNDVNILSDDMDVGEEVRVEVFFETKSELGGQPDGLDLIVRLSDAIDYVPGSSAIYDQTTDERDGRSPDDVQRCDNGVTYLVYRFDDNDLEGRSLSGADEFGIRFEISGKSRSTRAEVQAAANKSQDFSCDSEFGDEASDSVEVK